MIRELNKEFEDFGKKLEDLSLQIDNLIETAEQAKKIKILDEDFIIACLFGIIGTFISNSKTLDIVLKSIHDSPDKYFNKDHPLYPILKKLYNFFQHKGDNIDIPEGANEFVSRMGEKVSIHEHRIMWGHDIFSREEDNPFKLSIKQYGAKGILKAIKHLTADTFSSQGLPIPFHSFLDYKGGNRMIDWINSLAQKSINIEDQKFSFVLKKVFSINSQDIIASGLLSVSSNLYIKFKPIKYELMQSSFRLTTYSVGFLFHMGYGLIKYRVPFVNWTLIPLISKEIVKYLRLTIQTDKRVEKRMNEIIQLTQEIETENKRLMELSKKYKFKDFETGLDRLNKEFNFFSNL